VITDGQLILGLSRHLSAYSISPVHARLESLQFAGQVYEMAWRLRHAQLSSAVRVQAIGIEAKIGPRVLDTQILPTLEQLGWVRCDRYDNGSLYSVAAFIPPDIELLDSVNRLLDLVMATSVARAALVLLEATSVQPLEREAALQYAAAYGDEAAEEALRCLINIHLVREVVVDDGRKVVFNPNIWVGDEQVARAALKAEDARVSAKVGALLEEVIAFPGLPEEHVTSTEPRWVDFTVSVGLVERSVVQTRNGDEKKFLFSPHLKRDVFGVASNDPSGHVRQLVGSMIYASTFASWKLRSPGAFLHCLIRDGEAGGHERIAEDYPMLETAGTIEVVGSGRYARMRLLQADVAEAALEIIDSRGQNREVNETVAAIGEQQAYTHIERERGQLASQVNLDGVDAKQLIAALRDTTARRGFHGR
jgi:hypothetical protein